MERENIVPTRRLILIGLLGAIPAHQASAKKNKRTRKKANKVKRTNALNPKADATLPLLRDLAMHHQHSLRDEGTPIPDLVARYRAGETLHCICGSVSAVGVHLLREAGYQARVVGVVTKQPFVGDDGHIMLEVWQRGAWRLYDVDGNRRAVDSRRRGVSLVAQVAAGSNRRWEQIANDPLPAPDFVSTMPPDHPAYWTPAWDQRLFGTPRIVFDGWKWGFHDAAERTRLEAAGHFWLGKKAWQRMLGKP